MATYKYDVVDEMVLEATPREIIAAYADEFAGRSSWWRPTCEGRVRDGSEYPQVGQVLDLKVSGRPGGVDRRDATRFTEQLIAYEPERRLGGHLRRFLPRRVGVDPHPSGRHAHPTPEALAHQPRRPLGSADALLRRRRAAQHRGASRLQRNG